MACNFYVNCTQYPTTTNDNDIFIAMMNVCFDFYDNINSPTELYLFLVFKLFSFLMTHNFYVYCTQHPTTTNDYDIEQNYF